MRDEGVGVGKQRRGREASLRGERGREASHAGETGVLVPSFRPVECEGGRKVGF